MTKEEVIEKIETYIDLPENWDSYGGIAPKIETIQFVKEVVNSLPNYLYFCCPGPNGEVEIDWRRGDLEIEAFFDCEDKHEMLVYDKREDLYLYDGEFKEEVVKKFLDDLS